MAKTFEQLEADAKKIETEKRWGANTAFRIGRMVYDIIQKMRTLSSIPTSPSAPSASKFEPIESGTTGNNLFEINT